MSDLTLKPEALNTGDKLIAVPALAETAELAAPRKGTTLRSLRRRFSATRLAQPSDDGLRPFRVY